MARIFSSLLFITCLLLFSSLLKTNVELETTFRMKETKHEEKAFIEEESQFLSIVHFF